MRKSQILGICSRRAGWQGRGCADPSLPARLKTDPPRPGDRPRPASSISPSVHSGGRARRRHSPLTLPLALALIALKPPLDPPGFISVSKAESEQSLEQCPVANGPFANAEVTPPRNVQVKKSCTDVCTSFFLNLMELAVLN